MTELQELGKLWNEKEIEYAEARKALQEQIEQLLKLKEERKAINEKIKAELEKKFPDYRDNYDPRKHDNRYEKLPEMVKVKYRVIKAHESICLI